MSGEFIENDVSDIFLWMRGFASKEFSLVRDIGDFCAHRDKRDKGVSWQWGKNFCDLIAPIHAVLNNRPMLEAHKIKLRAKARLVSKFSLKSIGISQNDFDKTSESAINKILSFKNDIYEISSSASHLEKIIIEFLTICPFAPKPIIQPHFLWEVYNLLCKLKLINRYDVGKFEIAQEFITIFAMTRMHLSRIILKDFECELAMRTSTEMVNRLIVQANIVSGKNIIHTATVFMSTCDVRQWCNEILHPKFIDSNKIIIPSWNTPIDFRNGKIQILDINDFRKNRPIITYAKPEPDVVFLPSVDLNGPRNF